MNEAAGEGPSYHDGCPHFEAWNAAVVEAHDEIYRIFKRCCHHYFVAAAKGHLQLSSARAQEVQWHSPDQALSHFGRTHKSQSTRDKHK